MANSLDDNIFWKTRLEQQQAVQKQQMDELDAAAPVKKQSSGRNAQKDLTIDWKDRAIQIGLGASRPALALPISDAVAVDLTKLLALFRADTLDTAYKSNQNRIEANSLVTQTKNMATMSLVLNSVTALSGLIGYTASVSKVAYESEQAVEAAKKKGLDNQRAALDELQKKLEGLGDYGARLKTAEEAVEAAGQAVDTASKTVAMSENAVTAAQTAVNGATAALEKTQAAAATAQAAVTTASAGVASAEAAVAAAGDDPQAKAAAEAALTAARQNLSQAEAAFAEASAEVTKAQATVTTASNILATAKDNLVKAVSNQKDAQSVLNNANAALTTAQADARTGAELTAKVAATQKSIAEGTYAVDITNVAPKISELVSSSAIFIDKISEANPNANIQANFLNNLGIQPASGKSTTEMLTAELTARLVASGLSEGEAAALADLVMSGDTSALQSLPKTTLDAIEKFSNDVSNSLQSTLTTLGNALSSALSDAGQLPPATTEKIKLLYSTMAANLTLTQLEEEDMTTALLKLMGEVIQEMIELQEEEYEERKAIERQMENHI
ncbi:MAG: hypothetical protein IKN52_10640 [Victivallales bacterium]|nr:hypothetical protein [Victivallales bacterium]